MSCHNSRRSADDIVTILSDSQRTFELDTGVIVYCICSASNILSNPSKSHIIP
jgi:hypothetical protein